MRTSPGVSPSETVASAGSVALASTTLPPLPSSGISLSSALSQRSMAHFTFIHFCHCTFAVKHPISAVSYGPFNPFILQIISSRLYRQCSVPGDWRRRVHCAWAQI